MKDLSLLTEGDLNHPQLIQKNLLKPPTNEKRSIQAIFEEHVRNKPEAIAVCDEESTFTFAQVNDLANAVAEKIIALNTKTTSVVAIDVNNNCYLLVALVGTLKAGCAFVGLSDEILLERQRYICQEAQVFAIISQKKEM